MENANITYISLSLPTYPVYYVRVLYVHVGLTVYNAYWFLERPYARLLRLYIHLYTYINCSRVERARARVCTHESSGKVEKTRKKTEKRGKKTREKK